MFRKVFLSLIVFLTVSGLFTAQAWSSLTPSPACQKWYLAEVPGSALPNCLRQCQDIAKATHQESCIGECDRLCLPLDCKRPRQNQCLFYSTCLESRLECGKGGYPIGFGQKYCLKSIENKALSAKGEAWKTATITCLQKALIPFTNKNTIKQPQTCDQLQEVAFDSHVQCYTQAKANICDLSIMDWKVIAFDILELNDWLTYNGMKQATKVAFQKCRNFLIDRLLTRIRNSPNHREVQSKIDLKKLLDQADEDTKDRFQFFDELNLDNDI